MNILHVVTSCKPSGGGVIEGIKQITAVYNRKGKQIYKDKNEEYPLYILILLRITKIGRQARSSFAKLFCFGFAAAFFIYVIVNMAMVLGLLPIVGAPLPIMSYGGSAMLGIMFGLGIVMSSCVHKNSAM